MGGLCLGSFLAGQVIDKRRSPLKTYAVLELGIGLYALFLPFGMKFLIPFYLFLHPVIGENFILISLVRFLFSFLLLIIPSTLMGATFPVISRFFIREEDTIGKDAGTLYSLNTLGAVCGCLLTGFYLVENLGLLKSLYLAAALNIILASLSYYISRWEKVGDWLEEKRKKKKERPGKEQDEGDLKDKTILFLFGLSGFAALSLQVLWTRIFVFLIDNTVYAFTTILFTFLIGITLGSFCFSRMNLNQKNLRRTFGKMQSMIGIAGLLTLLLFLKHNSVAGFWNEISFYLFGGATGSFWTGKIFASFFFIFSLLILPTFFMGATFPVVFKICSPAFASAGRSLGLLYSINTFGAILGSFCAGFILLPALGTQKAIMLVSLASFLSGFYILRAEGKSTRTFSSAILPLVTIPFIFLAALLFYHGDVPRKISESKLDPGNQILFYKEGITGTVLASSQENDRTPYRKPIKRIWINGDPIAGSFREALQLEWLQAHIPLLLHPDPRNAVVVCFGTGSTAGVIARHPVNEIIAVDTAKGVYEAAPHFAEGNGNIVENKKFKAVVEDGRQFLATSKRKFDFITSEPPPPSNAGIVNLYAKEYYEICKNALKPEGMLSQWIPLHHLSPEDFRSLVATFVSVFPHSTMWYTKWDAIMIGSDRELSIDFTRLKQRMEKEEVQKSLREIGFQNPYRLLSTFMMGEEGLKQYTKGAAILTDDRPTVEFTAPRIHHIGVKIKGENLRALLKYRESPIPLIKNVEEGFGKKLSPFNTSQLQFYEGRLYENDNNITKAAEKFKKAIKRDPSFMNARFAFLKIHMDLAYYFLKRGRASAGLQVVKECQETDTEGAFRPQLLNLRGLFHMSKKEFHLAAMDFLGAVELDKDFPGPYMNLGTLYGEYLNDPKKAVNYFRQCLKLNIIEEERNVVEEEILKYESRKTL